MDFKDLKPEERKKKMTIFGGICCFLILAIIGIVVGVLYSKKDSVCAGVCEKVTTVSVPAAPFSFDQKDTKSITLDLNGDLDIFVSAEAGKTLTAIEVTNISIKDKSQAKNVPTNVENKVSSLFQKDTSIGGLADCLSCRSADVKLTVPLYGNPAGSFPDLVVKNTAGHSIVMADAKEAFFGNVDITTNGEVTIAKGAGVNAMKGFSIAQSGAISGDITINGGVQVDKGNFSIIQKTSATSVTVDGSVTIYGDNIMIIEASKLKVAGKVSTKAVKMTITAGGSLALDTKAMTAKAFNMTLGAIASADINLDCSAKKYYKVTVKVPTQKCAPVQNAAKPPVQVEKEVTLPLYYKCAKWENGALSAAVRDPKAPLTFPADVTIDETDPGLVNFQLCSKVGVMIPEQFPVFIDTSATGSLYATWNKVAIKSLVVTP